MNGLFKCELCDYVDHTDFTSVDNGFYICGSCNPDNRKSNLEFPREKYDPEKHDIINKSFAGKNISFG